MTVRILDVEPLCLRPHRARIHSEGQRFEYTVTIVQQIKVHQAAA